MSIQVTPIPRLTVLTAPAFTLGTANAAGSATSSVASDSTLLAFDTTLPDTIIFGQSGAVGGATVASRRDHAHATANVDAATQVQMEAASSTTVFDTPGRAQYHPGVAKVWAIWTTVSSHSLEGSYNVASIADNGTGTTTVWFGDDFTSTDYAWVGSSQERSGGAMTVMSTPSRAVDHINISTDDHNSARVDAAFNGSSLFGEQVDG